MHSSKPSHGNSSKPAPATGFSFNIRDKKAALLVLICGLFCVSACQSNAKPPPVTTAIPQRNVYTELKLQSNEIPYDLPKAALVFEFQLTQKVTGIAKRSVFWLNPELPAAEQKKNPLGEETLPVYSVEASDAVVRQEARVDDNAWFKVGMAPGSFFSKTSMSLKLTAEGFPAGASAEVTDQFVPFLKSLLSVAATIFTLSTEAPPPEYIIHAASEEEAKGKLKKLQTQAQVFRDHVTNVAKLKEVTREILELEGRIPLKDEKAKAINAKSAEERLAALQFLKIRRDFLADQVAALGGKLESKDTTKIECVPELPEGNNDLLTQFRYDFAKQLDLKAGATSHGIWVRIEGERLPPNTDLKNTPEPTDPNFLRYRVPAHVEAKIFLIRWPLTLSGDEQKQYAFETVVTRAEKRWATAFVPPNHVDTIADSLRFVIPQLGNVRWWGTGASFMESKSLALEYFGQTGQLQSIATSSSSGLPTAFTDTAGQVAAYLKEKKGHETELAKLTAENALLEAQAKNKSLKAAQEAVEAVIADEAAK